MNKGYAREASERLFDECVRHGVRVQLFVMVGFPSETEDEAQDTVDYLLANRDRILGVDVMWWRLTPGGEINENWSDYGLISRPGTPAGGDVASFDLAEGITRTQSVDIIQRMKARPELQCFFASRSFEDYRIILDMVKSATADSDDTAT